MKKMMDVIDKVAAKWVKAVSPAKRNRSTMLPEDVDIKPKAPGKNKIGKAVDKDEKENNDQASALARIGRGGKHMLSRNVVQNRNFTERGRRYRRTRMRRRT